MDLFSFACCDNDKEEFQTICKIGTGFTDVVLKELYLSLKSQVIPQPKSYYRYSENLKPDVWFEPTEVWEVKASDLTCSPVYSAATGVVAPDKRKKSEFCGFLRVREEKKPEDATPSEMVDKASSLFIVFYLFGTRLARNKADLIGK
ncbi:OLC1v1003772C1 [Oldenlandia corymbosa var. corymbosa]|uniref:OLC1v1003772C1 n=1 Tax=Oldenlandia corymbosa var. corymbosa TaxID=529605 RepID=A0AAV1DE60_OLDCO|nr:OLC1v1003772C1 [Oldenlandia corymbosa var. corymbosa]